MRYLAPAPKFSLFAATVILITLAVCPIGYAEAEKISFVDNQKDKKSLDQEDVLKAKRSLKYKDANIGDRASDRGLDKPLYYKKWGNDVGDDDLQYSSQSDSVGSDGTGYESDGYGYDDDEYDHFNYKRFDSDKDKLSQDDKMNKEANSFDKSALISDSKVNPPPEATTIELLSFQAKNLNPGAEVLSGKDEPKIKSLSMKKPPYTGKDSKESLVDDNLKKKTTSEQKVDDPKTSGNTGNDKTSGNVKISDDKVPECKDGSDNKAEKVKVSEGTSNARMNVQTVRETARATEEKGNAANDDKNTKFGDVSNSEVKISEKDVKSSDAKLQNDGKEDKDAAKVKEDKDMDSAITETKAAESAKEENKEKNLSQFVSSQANLVSSDYKDGFDNINTPGIIDDEKASEDVKENRINLAGLRDSRNELPYKYKDPGGGFHRSKYSKKEASDGYLRRKIGSRSNLVSGINWNTNPLVKEDSLGKNTFERGPKEPFHLDFPLADLENTDYHRNFIKSLKRFKGLDESSRILSQGDTPSPYADEAKKQLASKVIEEEQRKRRSRLRRLKANPIFASMNERGRDGSDVLYGYSPSARARIQYGAYGAEGPYGRNLQGYDDMMSNASPISGNNERREYSDDERELLDPLGEEDMLDDDDDDEYEEITKNAKNKRRDTAGFYEDEIETDLESEDEEGSLSDIDNQRFAEKPAKRKSQGGKTAWARSEYNGNGQKKKFKDLDLYEEPSRYNTPLLLLQRNDNGQQSLKTFTDGRYKNEDGIDSEDLARLLSRDSNYVVLKKVPGKDQVQKIVDPSLTTQGGRVRSTLGDQGKKEKLKVSQLDLVVKAQHPVSMDDLDLRKVVSTYKEARVEQPFKKKEDRIKDLSDFFKDHSQDKETDEKKEMLVSIDNRLSQFQRGEPNKRLMYKPPLSQAYRHMKDFENPDGFSDTEAQQRRLYNPNDKKNPGNNPNPAYIGPERAMQSFKKEGKDILLMNTRPFNPLAYKAKGQEGGQNNMVQNVLPANNAVPNSNMVPPITAVPNNNPLPTSNMFAAGNAVPNSNLPQTANLLPTSNMLPKANAMPNGYMMPSSNFMPPNALQNGLMQNNNNLMQIKLPEVSQKANDANRKYFLYGSESDMGTAPKHEIKVIQSDFGVPQDNTYGSQTYSLQNYNKPNPTKNTQSGKAMPFDKNTNLAPGQGEGNPSVFPVMQQPGAYGYGQANPQQRLGNGYQFDRKAPAIKENYKRVSKKESEGRQLSDNLKRFMRDFQGLGQAYRPSENSYTSQDLQGMSLQELTGHGDRHLQKLNNLLKEIINNKVEVSGSETRKNVKRGMFPKYKDQKNWQPGSESPADPQVRSGKWTSIVYDGSNQMEFVGKDGNISPSESFFDKDDKLDAARIATDAEELQNLYSKREKRESPYDGSKDSTKALEVKVKSTPYTVQLQPLSSGANANVNANANANANANSNSNNVNGNVYSNANGNVNSNANRNSNSNSNANGNAVNTQQQKSTARASLQLPPDKLLDLMNFIENERKERRRMEEGRMDYLCRRQAPFIEEPSSSKLFRRKLLSVNENEPEQEKKRAESVRKSFESYLDPLVQKISDYENKSQDKSKRSARSKREIELDESMPNDFQSFLVTSLGGFGNQKREVVKKDEALWEKDGTHDENQIVDGTGNREPNEESALGKRDTLQKGKRSSKMEEESNKSKSEKKSVSKENDATNIRIRIVDGNTDSGLTPKTSDNGKSEFVGKCRVKDKEAGMVASKNDAAERQDYPSVHEVYFITNKDSKKLKKKKFATPRSDQTPQKQPISNHLPQVETVYNPSPGGNKAQIEKINSNDAQMKLKCLAKSSNINNATASMMEDNIIRNNLRTGNINTFTYQRKEEPTPYPLQSPTNPPTSNEFEMLDSKNPARPKPFTSRLVGTMNHFAGSGLTNTNPEIIYKDEASRQFSNMITNAKPVFSKQGYRSYSVPVLKAEHLGGGNSGMKGGMYKGRPELSNADPYQKDYPEEDPSDMEYSDAEEANSFSDSHLNRQDLDYRLREASGKERDSVGQGIRRQDIEEDRPYARAQDNLNPKMVEMWNNYARTHLTPTSHQEAMNREFQEAYLRRNLGGQASVKYSGLRGRVPLNLRDEDFGASLIKNLNENDYDHLIEDNAEFEQDQEKLTNRLSKTKKRAGALQIGQRFFYTFKTEVPDEEYYALYAEPMKLKSGSENSRDKVSEGSREEKKSEDVQLSNRQQSEKTEQKTWEAVKRNGENVLENVIGSYIVRKSVSDDENGFDLEEDGPGAKRKRIAEVYQAGNDLVGHRVKRCADGTKSEDESKVMGKRSSSGHLTESHYRKYHRKNTNNKRDAEQVASDPDFCPRAKRDAISDAVRADMMKRIQEEKKAKSMIKNLKMELAKNEVPLIGPGMVPPEGNLPSEILRLEEEKRKNKMMEENSYRDDQQRQSPAKTGTPDVYRTFEIKRGRRGDTEDRMGNQAEQGEHNVVSRSEPDSYEDRVFLKGGRSRKVKKYSDEGFEPLTPDLRFSEKSSLNYYLDNRENKAAAVEPYMLTSGERTGSSSIVNRKAEEKSKVKDASSGKVPTQKLTHGLSHEAPLLTPTNPLSSPKIFDALKNSPVASPKNEPKALNKHANEEAVLVGTLNTNRNGHLQKGNHAFKVEKLEEGSKKSQPLVGAVLVLTKREKTNKRHARGEYSDSGTRNGRSPDRSARRDEYNEEASGQGGHSGMEKRSTDWREGEDISDFLHSDQSAEIVNEDAGCRSCGGESETKTCNHKQTKSFKQSPFSFSQTHNMNTDRNGGENRIGNSGEDILESILGRVESNPHFRKVIGPGLKWRGRKGYLEGEDRHRCCYSPPNRSLFVRQVRKILAKFVNDIEKLAAQDVRRNPCCKLDGRSNRFLHELLQVPYEADDESMEKQFKFQLDPILRGRGMMGTDMQSSNATSGDAKVADSASFEAMENRRQLVLKLLGEYQNLSENDRKRVEVLGQYLMHELEVLNSALSVKEEASEPAPTSATTFDKKLEEKSTSAATQGTEASTESVTFATESVQTSEKYMKRGSVKLPFIWSNPEDMKYLKFGHQARSETKPGEFPPGSGFQAPGAKDFGTFSTSSAENAAFSEFVTENPDLLAPSLSTMSLATPKVFLPTRGIKFDDDSGGYRPGKKGGELDKLGYGDAAGLQLSLKSHGPWLSNLDLGKGKPVDIWRRSKTFGLPFDPLGGGVSDLPYFREDSVDSSRPSNRRDALSEDDSDGVYDLEYQDYDDDDAYQEQGWKKRG